MNEVVNGSVNHSQRESIDRREFLVQSAGTLAVMSLVPGVLPAAIRLEERLEVGVIGLGKQGRAIMTELQKIEGVSITAVCDTDASRLESGVKRAPGSVGYATHKELLDKAKAVALIIIATPTHQHKEPAIDALAAGRHVYCETPLAHTIADARAIRDAARNAKVTFSCGLEGRTNPMYTLARSFYRGGSLRDLLSMRGQCHQKSTWRVPASDPAREKALNWRLDEDVSCGLAGEWGTGQFDVFAWYKDQYPVSVRGFGGTFAHADGRKVHDSILCEFAFEDGRRLVYEATLGNSYQGKHELLHGTHAAIKLAWTHGWMFKEADAPTQGWEVYANRQQFFQDEGITLIADATKLASQGKLKDGVGLPYPSLYYALESCIASCTKGTKPIAGAEEGYKATVMGLSAHQATVSGVSVDLTKDLSA